MSSDVVSVEGVWKSFSRWSGGPRTVKGALLHPLAERRRDRFWALQDINFRVPAGETVGLIGANGSGKSTLLRLIGGLGQPTRGRVKRSRRVEAILTLGESFDPLLTGRENAVTAGVLAGYTRKEVRAKLDAIVAFAELEEFFDLPIRMYSDGMRMRLAFSVATSTQPEIFLLDEVLSVGDLRFQHKCLQRLRELRDRGTTTLLASHDQEQIEQLCDRVIWLNHGCIYAYGHADEVASAYREKMQIETRRRVEAVAPPPHTQDDLRIDDNRFGTLEVEISAVRIVPSHLERPTPEGAMPVRVEIDLSARVPATEPIVGVSLRRVSDASMVLDVNTAGDNVKLGVVEGSVTVALDLDRLDLEPGTYRFDVGVYERDWTYVYDYHWQAYPLELRGGSGSGFGPRRRWSARKS